MYRKYYWRYKYRFKEWFFENITPKLPKIPVTRPIYPRGFPLCITCYQKPRIFAHNTGDGWVFFWDCDEQHIIDRNGDSSMIVGWFPFLFGWATGKDLERIGIEVV